MLRRPLSPLLSPIFSPLFRSLQQRWRKWIFLEHQPEVGEVFLRQRRVFTLPSKPGWVFLILLAVLFIGATNYNLSLGLALTFVLASCGVINTFLSFRNLAYLHLLAGASPPVFAGEEAQFHVSIINRRKNQRYAIWVGFAKHGSVEQAIDVAPNDRSKLTLSYLTETRGLLMIPRVRLQTWFPLGLLRAWSTWLPDAHVIVYPRPEPLAPPLPFVGIADKDGQGQFGDEDFSGVRAYQTGDAMKHLAWKHIARIDVESGGQLVTKQFSGGAAGEVLLDFSQLPLTMDVELKLSRMTSWVLQADASGLPYAFRLGQMTMAAATGNAYLHQCMEALARYPETGRALP